MPDLQEQQLSSQDDALILASDGLWDVLANQDAAQLIKDIKVVPSQLSVLSTHRFTAAHDLAKDRTLVTGCPKMPYVVK